MHVMSDFCVYSLQLVLEGKVAANSGTWAQYKNQAEQFIFSCIQKGNSNVKKTPAGLSWFLQWNNLQYTTTATFIATVYSEYLYAKRASIHCRPVVAELFRPLLFSTLPDHRYS